MLLMFMTELLNVIDCVELVMLLFLIDPLTKTKDPKDEEKKRIEKKKRKEKKEEKKTKKFKKTKRFKKV